MGQMGRGWGVSCPPVCSENRVDPSWVIQVKQTVGKDTRRLHQMGQRESERSQSLNITQKNPKTHSSCRNDPAGCNDRFGLMNWGQLKENQHVTIEISVCS